MAKYSVKYYLLSAGISLFSISAHFIRAESVKIDSLKSILAGASPIDRININYTIGSEFSGSTPDSAMKYYNEALRLSEESKNDTFTAKCLNRIGILYFNSGDYENSILNFFDALKMFERNQDTLRTIRCLQYLGKAYKEQGMPDKAIGYAKQSIELARAIGDSTLIAVGLSNLGSVYYSQSDNDKALGYFLQSLQIAEIINDNKRIADALNNVAVIYMEKNDFEKALEFNLRSLEFTKEFNDKNGIAASYHNIGLLYKSMKKYPIAIQYLDSCIMLAKANDNKPYLKDSYNTLSEVYSGMGNFEKAYQTHLLFSQLNDTLMNEETKRQFAEMNTKYETEKKDNQITLLNKDKEISEQKLRKQEIVRNGFMGGFAVVLLFAGVFFRQRNKTKKEKRRSDELLLNILPGEVAEELKLKGSADAKHYDDVTVMFTDFKGFTQISEKLTPSELVTEIHNCFKAFDNIITKYNIEKIKTIGDSYMCAGGLPVVNTTHASDVVNAALEMQQYMQEHLKDSPLGKFGGARIGIHTGPVVAGIVGIKKYAYDIWGDTVNIASRMEQNSEAGKINISGATYELVKGQAGKINFTHRGKIQAKNKGEIDMFFVNLSFSEG